MQKRYIFPNFDDKNHDMRGKFPKSDVGRSDFLYFFLEIFSSV